MIGFILWFNFTFSDAIENKLKANNVFTVAKRSVDGQVSARIFEDTNDLSILPLNSA